MKFRITRTAKPRPLKNRGGNLQAVNVEEGECAATITTRYEAIGFSNILTLAHFPMTVVLYEFE